MSPANALSLSFRTQPGRLAGISRRRRSTAAATRACTFITSNAAGGERHRAAAAADPVRGRWRRDDRRVAARRRCRWTARPASPADATTVYRLALADQQRRPARRTVHDLVKANAQRREVPDGDGLARADRAARAASGTEAARARTARANPWALLATIRSQLRAVWPAARRPRPAGAAGGRYGARAVYRRLAEERRDPRRHGARAIRSCSAASR